MKENVFYSKWNNKIFSGKKKIDSADKARCQIFYDNYAMKKKSSKENFKKNFMVLNPYNFPPSSRELRQQILRTIYIASVWSNAFQPNPSDLNQLDFGWCMKDGLMSCKWFDGNEIPEKVFDIVKENEIGKLSLVLVILFIYEQYFYFPGEFVDRPLRIAPNLGML